MNRKNSFILAAIALGLTLFSFLLSWREDDARSRSSRSMRLLSLAMKDLDAVTVYRGQLLEPVAAFRKNSKGRWSVLARGMAKPDTADPQIIEQLQAFINLASRNPAKDVKSEASGLEDFESAILLEISSGQNEKETLIIGNASDDGRVRYVAPGNDTKDVCEVHADLVRFLDLDPIKYRSLDLFDYSPDINRISLNPGGAEDDKRSVIMKQEPEGWHIIQPVRWPVDDEKLASLVQAFKALRAMEVAGEGAGDLTAFGITPESPRIIVTFGEENQEINFGRAAPEGGVYAVRKGREPIYRINSALLDNHLAKGMHDNKWVNRYRRRELEILKELPATIYLNFPEGNLVLARQDAEAKEWKASGIRDYEVDGDMVQNLIQTLATLRTQEFISERQEGLALYGLDKPVMRLVCSDPANRQIAGINLSGMMKGNKYYATIDGYSQVLEIPPRLAETILAPSVFYRSRLLGGFDWREVYEISIIGKEGKKVYRSIGRNLFQRYYPNPVPLEEDGPLFVRLLLELSKIKCLAYHRENIKNLAEFGLDQPELRVIVTLRPKDKKSANGQVALDLMIGREASDILKEPAGKAVISYARLGGENTVFLIDEKLVQALNGNFK